MIVLSLWPRPVELVLLHFFFLQILCRALITKLKTFLLSVTVLRFQLTLIAGIFIIFTLSVCVCVCVCVRVHGGVPRMQKWKPSWWEPRAIKGFLIPLTCSTSKYSFTCCACLQLHGFYLPSFCIQFYFPQSSTVECVLSSESEFLLLYLYGTWLHPKWHSATGGGGGGGGQFWLVTALLWLVPYLW